MFRTLRSVFGDPSDAALVAAAKETLRSPNAPLQEQATALGRLSSESDVDSKDLVLAIASNGSMHEWLQQEAGFAVAQMLEVSTVSAEEALRLTQTAREAAASLLDCSDEERFRQLAMRLRSEQPLSARAANGNGHGEASQETPSK